MDEVLQKLGNTLIDTDGSKTNFDSLYKNWGKSGSQEERRKETLEIQKSNRNNNLDQFRGILDLVNAVEENDIFKSDTKVHYRPSIYVAGFNKASPSYSNVLMLSEWMVDKPEDFDQNWYVVPCPKGVRMLVIANQGTTKCYTKHGHFRCQFRSALPGGNLCDIRTRSISCVLDCFYSDKTNTMFVLDVLAWHQPMTDGETEFRHYWLESKLSELPGLKERSKNNEVIFELLPKVSCSSESFNNFMMQCPMFAQNSPPLDGLLFYHKRTHYVSGQTPLVGWLFPFMVNEILGEDVTVNAIYKIDKPESYVNQADFILKFEMKITKKNHKLRGAASAMDTLEKIKEAQEENSLWVNPCFM